MQQKQASPLTFSQVQKAFDWYEKHEDNVLALYNFCSNSYPPTEDKNNPSIWKAEHWRWFLDNYI